MSEPHPAFDELDLADPLVKAVNELGYETPLPIQTACIPLLLQGKDVFGLAQTGTGKTGAFALPLLSRIDLSNRSPQVLVLTPTRELAIQVAEAFQSYARYLRGFHVLPVYGGQRYSFQFAQLRRGPHVIVGTPGRIQDHLNRGTLDLSGLTCVVLDEADEMLRMGFVEEVEAIMAVTPDERQMALFSATIPAPIKRIAKRYMKEPVDVRIEAKTTTADNIEQVYLMVPNVAKFEALARVLETESYDGILIFSRTKISTTELAEKLAARGFDVAPLNGDMNQTARERTIQRLKNGNIDIVVATDVAARGLDVNRISLVINYDIPGDSEAYIHRIGRTGRVGRYGKAILFANPRETRLLKSIEHVTRQPIARMDMPSHGAVTKRRVEKFRDYLVELMDKEPMAFFQELNLELMENMNIDIWHLAAGLLCLAQKERPLRESENSALSIPERKDAKRPRPERGPSREKPAKSMALYRVEVGSADGIEVRNIVGAIANETGLQNRNIGQIRIHPEYSTIELPGDLPRDIIDHLKTTYIAKKSLKLSRVKSGDQHRSAGESTRERKSEGGASRQPRRTTGAPGTKAPKSRASKTQKFAGLKAKRARKAAAKKKTAAKKPKR